ncbi:hypothetical protein CFN78_20240 [Amycolatopsis antarctica]|uniref:lysozyme n=1 Tax=Amycolatopsis antarctica TaxID=1854586 RepID=A0A263CZF2_9PSEU|nr:hypothetical protein CFN78_20240 [Amycolatopsis antarctica]
MTLGALLVPGTPASAASATSDAPGGPGSVVTGAGADYSLAASNRAGVRIAAEEGVHGGPSARSVAAGQTWGHDVSGHQGPVDWKAASGMGARFVYAKATEGTGYLNPHFDQQYGGARASGMVRGAYHFARPDVGPGGPQADYFVDHGGGWSADGNTLPGALDVEYNPYSEDKCYGLDPAAMTAWIKDFSDTYQRRTGRAPTIYTSTSWWQLCTGGSTSFGSTNPLWLARYAPEIGPLPAGWPTHSIWQFAAEGTLPGDQNYFNGSFDQLGTLARG